MVSEAGGWMEWNGEVLILFLWSETDVINKKSLKTYTYLFIHIYKIFYLLLWHEMSNEILLHKNYFYFELKFVFVVINTQ